MNKFTFIHGCDSCEANTGNSTRKTAKIFQPNGGCYRLDIEIYPFDCGLTWAEFLVELNGFLKSESNSLLICSQQVKNKI